MEDISVSTIHKKLMRVGNKGYNETKRLYLKEHQRRMKAIPNYAKEYELYDTKYKLTKNYAYLEEKKQELRDIETNIKTLEEKKLQCEQME